MGGGELREVKKWGSMTGEEMKPGRIESKWLPLWTAGAQVSGGAPGDPGHLTEMYPC